MEGDTESYTTQYERNWD